MDPELLKAVAKGLSGALKAAVSADTVETTFDPKQEGNLFGDIGPDEAFVSFRILASPARLRQATEVAAAIDKAIEENNAEKLKRISAVVNTLIPSLRTIGLFS